MFYLGLGIGCIALIVGYMAGGSSTPIAGTVAPAFIGILVGAIGVLQQNQLQARLKELSESDKDNSKIAELKADFKKIPRRVGVMLILLSIFFLIGASLGTWVRVSEYFGQFRPAIVFPWENEANNKPSSFSQQLEWIEIQATLLSRGLKLEQINTFYDDWYSRQPEPLGFPWADELLPLNLDTAIVWLKTEDYLRQRGHAADEIKQFFELPPIAQSMDQPISQDTWEALDTARTQDEPTLLVSEAIDVAAGIRNFPPLPSNAPFHYEIDNIQEILENLANRIDEATVQGSQEIQLDSDLLNGLNLWRELVYQPTLEYQQGLRNRELLESLDFGRVEQPIYITPPWLNVNPQLPLQENYLFFPNQP